VSAACKGTVVVGAFSPQIQCEWTDDTSSFVASSPVVADLPNDNTTAEIVFVSFATGMGGDNANTASPPARSASSAATTARRWRPSPRRCGPTPPRRWPIWTATTSWRSSP
jgi:hypothetical protein